MTTSTSFLPAPPVRRRAARGSGGVLAAAGAVTLVLAVAGCASPSSSPATGPSATAPAAPAAASSASEEPQPTAAETPLKASSTHLRIQDVGLDLPVLPLTPRGGVINPPTLREGYWIQPYGSPGPHPDDTVYIAAHSWSRGDAAFNPLMDRAAQRSTLHVGDDVELDTPRGTVHYAVTATHTYVKGQLPTASAVWEQHPGRLVLITCFQRADGGRSTDNLVITAEAAP